MVENRTIRNTDRIKLPGPRTQYANGDVVESPPIDLERILTDFLERSEAGRAEFLSAFAHSLTVDIRAALFDRPVADDDAARAYQVNEWLHQLTSCLSPRNRRGAKGEAELLSDIAADSFRHGLERAVGRAITAANSAFVRARQSVAIGA